VFYKEARFDLISALHVDYNDLAQKHNSTYERDNVAIVATLQPKTGHGQHPNKETRRVVVATTHFYWDPRFAHVKAEQARMLLDKVREVYNKAPSGSALFIAGDFNSIPDSEVYSTFRDDSLKLQSAYSSYGEPETHFTTHYYGCLDYIWHTQKNAQLTQVLQPVPPALCENKCEFPSPRFPSDHLPLMARYVLVDGKP